MGSKTVRKLGALLLCTVVCLQLTACGSSSSYNDSYYQGVAGIESDMAINADSVGTNGFDFVSGFGSSSKSESASDGYYEGGNSIHVDNEMNSNIDESTQDSAETINYEKLIYRATYDIETKEYDKSVQTLQDTVSGMGGFIDQVNYSDSSYYGYGTSSRHGYRKYSCVLRVPSEKYKEFTGSLGNIGHIHSSYAWVENISSEYYDNVAYLESYENQLVSLQNMYSMANTIEEMMSIEARIAEVNAQILRLKTEIRSMDMDVAYSTIELSITEVIDYSSDVTIEDESTFFSRLAYTIKDSWIDFLDWGEDFLFEFIYAMWYLMLIAIIVIVIVVIRKKNKPKRMAKKLAKAEKRQERLEAKRLRNGVDSDGSDKQPGGDIDH